MRRKLAHQLPSSRPGIFLRFALLWNDNMCFVSKMLACAPNRAGTERSDSRQESS